MLGETPERSRFYQLWKCRECNVNQKEVPITKAVVPLFHDQIEKAVHAFDRTVRIIGWRASFLCFFASLLVCG